MRRNIGMLDTVLRIVIGIALLALVFTGPRTPWGYLGLVPILTGIFGFCPLYRLFGFSTNRAHRRDTHAHAA